MTALDKAWDELCRAFSGVFKAIDYELQAIEREGPKVSTTTVRLSGKRLRLFGKLFKASLAALFTGKATITIRQLRKP